MELEKGSLEKWKDNVAEKEARFKQVNNPILKEYKELSNWIKNEFSAVSLDDYKGLNLDGSEVHFSMGKNAAEKIDQGLKKVCALSRDWCSEERNDLDHLDSTYLIKERIELYTSEGHLNIASCIDAMRINLQAQ